MSVLRVLEEVLKRPRCLEICNGRLHDVQHARLLVGLHLLQSLSIKSCDYSSSEDSPRGSVTPLGIHTVSLSKQFQKRNIPVGKRTL